MNAEIYQRTAAGQFLVGEPASVGRTSAAALPSASACIDPAELAFFDIVFEVSRDRAETVVSDDHESLAALFGSGFHLFGLNNAYSVGFFAEHVDPAVQRVNGNYGMIIVRSADIDRIQSGDCKQIVIVFEYCGRVAEVLFLRIKFGFFLGPLDDDIAKSNDLNFIDVQICGKMRGTIEIPANSDNETAQKAALELENVKKQLEGKEIRKIIVVPNRIVNIVA